MSRQNKNWNKPGQSSWGKMQSSRAHPPGLRGRQIGLYFRDQKRRLKHGRGYEEKPKKQFTVRLYVFILVLSSCKTAKFEP